MSYKYVIIKARKFVWIDFLKIISIVEEKGNICSGHVWLWNVSIGQCLENADSSNK